MDSNLYAFEAMRDSNDIVTSGRNAPKSLHHSPFDLDDCFVTRNDIGRLSHLLSSPDGVAAVLTSDNNDSKVLSQNGGPKTPSQQSGPRVPSQNGGPNTPSQSSGPKTPSQNGGPKTPSQNSGPKTPFQNGGPKTPSQNSGPRTPSQNGGPRTPLIGSGPHTPASQSSSNVVCTSYNTMDSMLSGLYSLCI